MFFQGNCQTFVWWVFPFYLKNPPEIISKQRHLPKTLLRLNMLHDDLHPISYSFYISSATYKVMLRCLCWKLQILGWVPNIFFLMSNFFTFGSREIISNFITFTWKVVENRNQSGLNFRTGQLWYPTLYYTNISPFLLIPYLIGIYGP